MQFLKTPSSSQDPNQVCYRVKNIRLHRKTEHRLVLAPAHLFQNLPLFCSTDRSEGCTRCILSWLVVARYPTGHINSGGILPFCSLTCDSLRVLRIKVYGRRSSKFSKANKQMGGETTTDTNKGYFPQQNKEIIEARGTVEKPRSENSPC